MNTRFIKAFTLVELVIIVLILGILGAVFFGNLHQTPEEKIRRAEQIKIGKAYDNSRSAVLMQAEEEKLEILSFSYTGLYKEDSEGLMFLVVFRDKEGNNHYRTYDSNTGVVEQAIIVPKSESVSLSEDVVTEPDD